MAVKRVAVQLHAVDEIIYFFIQMLTVNKWISGCLLKRYGRDVSRRIVLLPGALDFFFFGLNYKASGRSPTVLRHT